MFGLGGFGLTEMAIVAATVLLLFGARHLPAIGSELGRAARRIKEGLSPRKVEDIELPEDFPTPKDSQKGVDKEN